MGKRGDRFHSISRRKSKAKWSWRHKFGAPHFAPATVTGDQIKGRVWVRTIVFICKLKIGIKVLLKGNKTMRKDKLARYSTLKVLNKCKMEEVN